MLDRKGQDAVDMIMKHVRTRNGSEHPSRIKMREPSEFRKAFLELQDLLDIRNQLERIPQCELKSTLEYRVEAALNPGKHEQYEANVNASIPSVLPVKEQPSPAHMSAAEFLEPTYRWTPDDDDDPNGSSYHWPIISGVLLLVLYLLFHGRGTVSQPILSPQPNQSNTSLTK